MRRDMDLIRELMLMLEALPVQYGRTSHIERNGQVTISSAPGARAR